jgi:ADP-ribose pyrophosphatase YjhB (NUDIX family)
VASDGRVVVVSLDGVTWDFPAGRPEAAETWEETLHREMREEACAVVLRARLLGFGRSACVEGAEQGRVIVRSFWGADVAIEPWQPRFEIPYREVVTPAEVERRLGRSLPEALFRIHLRAIHEAGLA